MPKVSVIVPVYNVETYIERCVRSIAASSLFDIEIILVDDGSTDKSFEICEKLSKNDKRIKVIKQQNSGVYSAVLNGIKQATGVFTTFVDSDDYISENLIEKMLDFANKKNVDGVHTGFYKVIGETAETVYSSDTRVYSKNEIEQEILQNFFETTYSTADSFTNSRWAKLFKTEILKKAAKNCNESLTIGEDLDLNLRFLKLCEKIAIYREYIGYYYISQREGSITSCFNYERLLKEQLAIEEQKKLAQEFLYSTSAIDNNAEQHLYNYLNANNFFFDKLKCVKTIMKRIDSEQNIVLKSKQSSFPINVALRLIAFKYVFFGTTLFHIAVIARRILKG